MSNATEPRNNFAAALRTIRKSKGLSQEAFGLISSRTYVSTLERKIQSPTLNKVDDLAEVMGVHPLTLLAVSYLRKTDASTVDKVLAMVAVQISELEK
ncbi:helix-turn-helix domain-containing protein [Rhodoferax sp. TS-BS-61-7]|uniref:helix-turn-helix domain-containing protein n=1 Tax=Rhodoferax sp. TS-BS-61-7 TaxID=2094194 RepID=UPI000CF6E370|nr:helix-turn-helix transcriptional regulator [Rhodoferax sp. TS-BS-61-7]PQA75955.1 XRE family transcriptional regulator [Rhodoferax sp. TS-BS-61-7]